MTCCIGSLVLLGADLLAQNTGSLRMVVDPGSDYEFIVDHKQRMQQREIKLTEGLHHFSFWAPERQVVDTTVFVIANKTSDLVMRLPYSEEYAQYRKDLSMYKSGRRMRKISPVILAGGLVWTGLSIAAYGKAKDQLDADRNAYATSADPGVINRLKNELIPEHNNDLQQARGSLIAGSVVSALGAGAMWYVWHKTKGQKNPVFQDQEKVRFDGLSWTPSRDGGMWYAGVTIPLGR